MLLQSTAPLGLSDVPGYGISVPGHSNELPEVDFAGHSLSPQCTAESTSAVEPPAIQATGIPPRISNRQELVLDCRAVSRIVRYPPLSARTSHLMRAQLGGFPRPTSLQRTSNLPPNSPLPCTIVSRNIIPANDSIRERVKRRKKEGSPGWRKTQQRERVVGRGRTPKNEKRTSIDELLLVPRPTTTQHALINVDDP